MGSETSRCHSTTWRSQARRCSSCAETGPSLYFQWAAMPSSAILCISSVRIWISKGVAVFGDHRGVQRLVEIRPRHGDEVLDAAGHRTPEVVDDAEHGVAVLHRLGDDAHGVQVVHLVDADALALQFLVNAVEALDAALDASR